MWTKLRLRNFKAYEDSGEVELTPLTILIGPNSGGKSSILKALLVLRQTAECRDVKVPLHTDGPYCSLGEYGDFVFKGDKTSQVSFELAWELPDEARARRYRIQRRVIVRGKSRLTAEVTPTPTSFHVTWGLRRGRLVVNHLAYGYRDDTVLIRLNRLTGGAYVPESVTVPVSWRPPKSRAYAPERFFQLPAELLLNASAQDEHPSWTLWPRLQEAQAALEQQISATWYVGPLRYDPRRTYQVSAERPSDVGLKGERTVDALYVAKRDARASTDSLKEWVQRIGLADDIDLERLKASFHSLVVADRLGYRANVVDAGFGVSQLFPILMEAFYAPPYSTILLEQPEIHLNPRIQAGLGDVFVDLVLNAHKQFIIETHSEHLISRIRTAIAKGQIAAGDVSVYYCSLEENAGRVLRLPITELGEFEQWPEGFFEDEVREAFARTQAVFESKGAATR